MAVRNLKSLEIRAVTGGCAEQRMADKTQSFAVGLDASECPAVRICASSQMLMTQTTVKLQVAAATITLA